MDDNDEVSAVIRHFRPKPGFVPTNQWAHGVGHAQRTKRRRERGYSSVRYLRDENKLRLSYLHDRSAFLKFDVSLAQPMRVDCVQCSTPERVSPDTRTKIRQQLADLCGELSSSSAPSLFFLASRLLQSLNNDLPPLKYAAGEEDENVDDLISRTTAAASSFSATTIRRILDLEVLLMRSSASCRKRANLCSPVPEEFSDANKGDADAIACLVFAATDRMDALNLPGQKKLAAGAPEEGNARALLAFLLSLPWTEGGNLTVAALNDQPSTSVHLCLDVGCAIGDACPSFARLARERGTVTAYHGTSIDNAWSILNYGLQNLSDHGALTQNGAMMGEGVYLSTSYDVAAFFSKTAARSTPAQALACRHPSLIRLLRFGKKNPPISNLGTLDGHTVSCLPVFEASIVAPPDGISGDKDCTRREGKYFVVPNGDNIRITKLHLTLELAKKGGIWVYFPPFYVIVIAVLAIWIVTVVQEAISEEWESH